MEMGAHCKEFAAVAPDELAETVFARLQSSSSRAMPVMEQGELLGILTTENLGEYLMVQTALHHEPPGRQVRLRMSERHAT